MYTGVRPPKGRVAEKILANAVFECITNTARHADGDELYITVSGDGAFFTARIGNNGRPPKAEIVEGGGLSSLRRITEMAGGSMKTESFPRFLLSVGVLEAHDPVHSFRRQVQASEIQGVIIVARTGMRSGHFCIKTLLKSIFSG